jgi:hypothetical protein
MTLSLLQSLIIVGNDAIIDCLRTTSVEGEESDGSVRVAGLAAEIRTGYLPSTWPLPSKTRIVKTEISLRNPVLIVVD